MFDLATIEVNFHWMFDNKLSDSSRLCLIAALIIALLFFFTIQELDCIGALCSLQFKEFELYWSAVFFLRCVHTFFNDFDLSKRDKQVKPSRH